MRNIWTIVKKELARVFTDKRVIFSLFILPPLTIYLIYGLMGMSAENENKKVETYHPTVYIVNSPGSITGLKDSNVQAFSDYLLNVQRPEIKKDSSGNVVRDSNGDPVYQLVNIYTTNTLQIKYLTANDDLAEKKTELKAGQFDMIIEFPSNFVTQIENYQDETSYPNVNVYYYMNSSYSQATYTNISYILGDYKSAILHSRFTDTALNAFTQTDIAQGNINKANGSIIGMILPLLLVIYLMAGAMGIGIESIAGEKERGTIATLLVTPIKRSQLAIGKIISIAMIAVLSSVASFLGLLAVLPQFSKMSGNSGESLGKVSYALADYGMILGVMLVAVLFFVALIVVVSTHSKTVKEAGTLIMPIYLIVMGASFFNMFSQSVPQSLTTYLIPVYNVVVALKAIFQFDLNFTNWLVTIASTLVYTFLLIFLIQKMFRSEKVMFNK